MKLTIGIATHNDSRGLWATLQAMRIYLRNELVDTELIVVDNDPHGRAAKRTAALTKSCRGRYIPLAEPVGVYPARNLLFAEATGEVVYCLDSHVMLWPGSLTRLSQWFAVHPESKDILSGPMITDSLNDWVTHLAPVWRGDSFGIWGTAMKAPTGEVFALHKVDDKPLCVKLDQHNTPADFQPALEPEHLRTQLRAAGCRRLGPRGFGADHYDDLPIFAMGMGAFACRKDAWPGFHPALVGHGGGEITIHEKFRQQGGQALSQSWLGWHHCTDQDAPTTFPLTTRNRVRNYAISFGEVGWRVQDVGDHYVGEKKITEAEWQAIKADPINAPADQPRPRVVRTPPPKEGPGTQFKEIAAAAGANVKPGCTCESIMRSMNTLGVEGCRVKENRDLHIAAMRANMEKWGWRESFAIAAGAVKSGLVLKVNWLDPIPDMYDLAVDAEENRLAAIPSPAA